MQPDGTTNSTCGWESSSSEFPERGKTAIDAPPADTRARSIEYCRLAAVAVALPITIAVMDQWLIVANQSSPAIKLLLPPLFISQVAILGFGAGRFINNGFLRLFVFIWSMTLVDCVAFTTLFFEGDTTSQCMAFALVSGQFGLITVWGTLGPMHWTFRIPILLVITSLIVLFLMRARGSSPWGRDFQMWALILAAQSIVMLGLSGALRLFGYRLWRSSASALVSPEQEKQLQFSLQNLILWTTATCPVLVAAKGVEWIHVDFAGLFRIVLVGLGLAVIMAIATWSTLGDGNLYGRLLILFFVPLIVGAGIAAFTSRFSQPGQMLWILRRLGWMWIGWSFFAAWFLAALLLVFRAAGYRLMRNGSRVPS